ncbi:guanylate cyclase soluble subunit beta-2-like [Mizuhopecten yessoensis]|nr:guanylate cyclase soluble subunit beta-2-like [Mizuhopecten yessoensis]
MTYQRPGKFRPAPTEHSAEWGGKITGASVYDTQGGYGHLNVVLKTYVLERHGEAQWKSILKEVNHSGQFQSSEKHDDALTQKFINAAVHTLGLKRDAFLTLVGEFFMEFLNKNSYDELIRNLGSNTLDFVQNLDYVQTYLKEEYQEEVMPSFRCEGDSVSDRMTLHYYSVRPGYICFITGFLTAVAKSQFGMQLTTSIISITAESVAQESGYREHVIINILAKKPEEKPDTEGPPTFVAQTPKNAERQILKTDVDAVRARLEEILRTQGEDALPLNKYRSAKAKWKAIAKISLFSRGFVASYPHQSAINPKMFIDVFPYHLVFDSDMKLYQTGVRLQKMMPSIRSRMAKVTDFFTLKYPRCTDFTFENIKNFIMCPFILEVQKDRLAKDFLHYGPFQVKGQMFFLMDRNFFFFICSPVVRSWPDLEKRDMKMADIPIWDATRDFLLTDLTYRIAAGQTTVVQQDTTLLLEQQRLMALSIEDKEHVTRLQKDLNSEKNRNDNLYHAFLPRQLANMIREGRVYQGEYFPEMTALFCDVVQFINLVSNCKPSDVVGVLNSLYTRFDKVTKVHDTYRVESIGDAYFVVAGVPEKIDNHAERIANTALGMMHLSHEVANPMTGGKIMIRIGIHTGSMVCGVVGTRLPRFIVLGETAVVASKMESHGEPGKIHISPSTYRLLKGKGFTMEDRGRIELRGFGPIGTFFLTGNEHAADDDLVGRSKLTNQDIAFINEGHAHDHKKANQTPSSGVGSRPPTGDSEFATFAY